MDKNERRKKRLDKYCPEFVETVEVKNILRYFPKMTKGTKESIERKAVNEGNEAGAYELYLKITKADSDWYEYLMKALRKAGYLDLLKLLQDDDDGNDGTACRHPEADSRTALMKSSSTNTVEQPINFPHQEVACGIYANAEQTEHRERDRSNVLQCMPQRISPPQSPQQAPPAQSTQRASFPQSTQRASSPQSTQGASSPQSTRGASHPQSSHQAPSAQSTHWASSPKSAQGASSPQPPQQTFSPLSPELSTNTNQNVARHQPDYPVVDMDIVPQQRIPLSPEAYTRPGEDSRQDRGSTRVFHREPEEIPSVNELTLGQVHQGVREAFNKLMNDNSDYPLNNWKSLAAKLNMTVDEVNSIHGALQLYEVLRTRGMRLVELLQLLQEMERADMISEIKKFYDLSDMDLPEQPAERLSPNFSRQTSKKTTKSMWEPPENKQEIKLKETHKQPPDPIIRNLDEINNKGKNLMNFEPDEQVKREAVVERSSPAPVVDNPASRNDLKPMMANAMKVRSSSTIAEQLTMPYVPTSEPVPLNSVNQPPFDSLMELEQSASFVLNSVPRAPESRKDGVMENVDEMGDAHEKEDKGGHQVEHQEEAENDVPENSDSEGSLGSSESTVPRRARNLFSILSSGALALTTMNRL